MIDRQIETEDGHSTPLFTHPERNGRDIFAVAIAD